MKGLVLSNFFYEQSGLLKENLTHANFFGWIIWVVCEAMTCFRMCATGLPVEKGEVIESALEVSDLKKNVIFGVSMFQNL